MPSAWAAASWVGAVLAPFRRLDLDTSMTSKKKLRKERRQTYKTMEAAWNALERGEDALADKLSRRSLDRGFMNPRVWVECASMLEARGDVKMAVRLYETALSIAPGYVEAREALERLGGSARLPEFGAEQRGGTGEAAAREMAAPVSEAGRDVTVELAASEEGSNSPASAAPKGYAVGVDWSAIDESLTRRGCARVPELLSRAECEALRATWSCSAVFEHSVRYDDDRGRLEYRFFARPLPAIVASVRAAMYPSLARIANRWDGLLGRSPCFPTDHDAFLAQCQAAGQFRTTPILLRYDAGGFNAFHRDVHGEVFFPFQLAITLGPASSDGGGGGELALLEERPGRRRVAHCATSVGDGVVFCTRDRIVPIGGLYGLQPVLHGVTAVLAGERFAVGIPFHDYLGG
jgi:hypothetical protein